MRSNDSELYRQALLLDFVAFNHRCFREINPTTPFDPNWHIEAMGAALEDCRFGRNRRLIINVPPRSLKSLTASVAFPAWLLGHNPSTKIITANYGQDSSEKHARDLLGSTIWLTAATHPSKILQRKQTSIQKWFGKDCD